jgi:hypothetical protein
MRGTSQQALVDKVFTALSADAQPVCGVSDRAFAKARSHLHVPAVTALNDDLLARAEAAGGVVPKSVERCRMTAPHS